MSEKENTTNLSAEAIAALAAQSAASAVKAVMEETAASGNQATLMINKKVQDRGQLQANYAARISAEMKADKNCVDLIIPRVYYKYQPSFTASVNGCTVNIPADGKTYKVHNDFAVIIIRRMRRLDERIASMSAPDISEYSH